MDKAGKRIAGTNAIGLKYQSLSILTLRFRSGFTMNRDTHRFNFFFLVRQVKAGSYKYK